MNVFAKIFAQIFDSSIAADHLVRHVFMDMLVLADREGVVDMTTDAIARRTNVPEEQVIHAIKVLMEPDKKSRSHAEDGRRLVALDSHRDWGWQIVNFEHYRNIRDEEARRTYFRDKQREHRSKTPKPSQTMSSGVKDSQQKSTQGEVEVEREGETEGKPLPPPLKNDLSDSGSELMAANWLLEELCVPADNGTRRVAAEAIRLLAKEGGTVEDAMRYIFDAGKKAIADGEKITRFWFTDQRYKPQQPKKKKWSAPDDDEGA